MRSIHKTLHLQHHRHTGRKLHHRHTSYRGLVLVLVAAGAFMVGLSVVNHAAVEAFGVGATVQAPVPTTPPIITSLSDDTTLSSDSQVVAGSCPIITPQVTVSILVDGVSAGSGICSSTNDFVVPVRFAPGPHTVTAQGVTITGDPGPESEQLHITYTAAASKAIGTVTSQPNGPVTTVNPLVITPDGTLLYLGGDNTLTWSGSITGGTPPYKVLIDWGDGSKKTADQASGPASFDHKYADVRPYNMSISVTDARNVALHQQFAVATYATASAAMSATDDTTSSAGTSGSVVGLYGLYLTVLAVFGIVWLEAKHTAKEVMHGH